MTVTYFFSYSLYLNVLFSSEWLETFIYTQKYVKKEQTITEKINKSPDERHKKST